MQTLGDLLPCPRIVLMVGDDGLVAVPHDLPDASPFFVPADNKAAAKGLIDFIAQRPQARITLFADNVAQDYRNDDLPPLNRLDRAKLVQRRLKQTFPQARLTAGILFKHNPRRALLIGLHALNSVFAWTDRLQSRTPDIALLPVEGARLLAKLMAHEKGDWKMLVSRQRSGGFRQIVTHKNDLVFTRLTPLPHAESPESDAEILARDIKASLDYLSRLGLRTPNELNVLLLALENKTNVAAFASLPLKSIRFMSPAQAATRLGLPFGPAEGDASADLLYAAYLIKSLRPALPLMLPETRKDWIFALAQKWGIRMAYASLAAATLLALVRAGDLATTLYLAQKDALRLTKTEYLLSQEKAKAAPLTEPLGIMRQALERRHIFEKSPQTPWHGINEFSNGLDLKAKLTALEWESPSPPGAETFRFSIVVPTVSSGENRAETVDAFNRIAQFVATSMPDYKIIEIKPPYPSLPSDSVSAISSAQQEIIGELSVERRQP